MGKISDDYQGAAVRHFVDAKCLHAVGQHDNAGYLAGLAAECAIKHAVRSLSEKSGKQHLPNLIGYAKTILNSRKEYHDLSEAFDRLGEMFKTWDIAHRYASTGTVELNRASEWLEGAALALRAARIRVAQP